MGLIYIRMSGSLNFAKTGAPEETTLYAEQGGHASAIQKAIGYLNDRLPAAIREDHRLHGKGEKPSKADFGNG